MCIEREATHTYLSDIDFRLTDHLNGDLATRPLVSSLVDI